ncbi:CopM family metallochaperone [Methylobacterium oxalidis]|uniref:DUF305 domain-containing protein n=1 Tax=Methylobacterium oxalidis TaxID=944322 RepID=A0A512JCW5_9HYPH|nr:DUF305 domain-containing protein [Methylobacterium oxalidis]GEP07804.1 hypothetical protein MOX02_58420 [Methylobacterium oxalidis]GLS63768.1 hypothetical protein GCM10007888_21490 [Methylobacterium oxalidis]
MHPTSHPGTGRRVPTRPFTTHALTALALAAGLSLVPLPDAAAQHGGRHGHPGHHGAGPRPQAAPAKARGAPRSAHAGHAASAGDGPAVSEFKAAHAGMMRGMDLPYTGDPDTDFRIQMIPHHQGAIDMARVALRHAKDPWTRQLAEAVIVEQQREIAEMQAWLARRGAAVPQASGPRHVLGPDSYRSHTEEPGTRAEARGQSWAPGAGLPAAR